MRSVSVLIFVVTPPREGSMAWPSLPPFAPWPWRWTLTIVPVDHHLFEPRRVCRRLQLLSKVEHHEQDNEQVFSGSA